MKKTNIVWRRLGREHGDDDQGLLINPPDVVEAHLRSKLDMQNDMSDNEWRWWETDDGVLYERPYPSSLFGPSSAIYYLPARNWVIMRHVQVRSLGRAWSWYVHVGDIAFDEALHSWVFTDLFADVALHEDGGAHTVTDLDVLAEALEMGLVSCQDMGRILRATQELVDLARAGAFPPKEIEALLEDHD
jgi:hypothetical protein